MNNLAENLESIFEAESVHLDQMDCDVVEFSAEHHDSLPVNFMDEIDAWARHCLAANGFGDF